MLDHFSWRHIPALLTAAPMFFGGLFHGLLKPKAAILTWGMTEEIARSREAQIVYYGHTMRTSTLGLLVFAFYFMGDLKAVDVTMAIMGGYCGIADCICIWKYGDPDHHVVPFRFLSILCIAAWGLAGMTSST
ncbi:multicopper oxidase type secreted protein [Rutstroemia sp. NJR-2017a WRK4]|nr:multicopper oxidase type secreted protein [Rutstroemia sp. NJR-2017a WRK4]